MDMERAPVAAVAIAAGKAGHSSPVHNELMKQKENVCLVSCKCGRVKCHGTSRIAHRLCVCELDQDSGAPCKDDGWRRPLECHGGAPEQHDEP
jgi:hypothetical protein